MSKETKNDYRSTLQLPKTSFSMRANLLQTEPRFQQRWDRLELYRKTRRLEHPAGLYILHDGPPYANGPIHMGHLLNKILKDLVVRSRIMQGRDVEFVPGWDCHGLPIEHKVLKELGEKASDLGTLQVRKRCQDYAARYVRLQTEQMRRLGTLADYANPYRTMNPEYEAAVLEVFAGLVAEGLAYRDIKPVHWSIANQTALAEAELEYYEKTDTSVYVLFEMENAFVLPAGLGLPPGESASLMIWTTTPWTLPANQAVAVAPAAEYALYRCSMDGATFNTVVAEELSEKIFRAGKAREWKRLGRCRGEELAASQISYRHPFIDRAGVVVTAEYVTLEDGTGLVHTAPGHGAEDYLTGIEKNLPVYCPVQGDGTFDDTVPEWLRSKDVWTANALIVEHLRRSGHLFSDHQYVHSYPHDWRSKTPTIFRATEQWFIAVDRPFGAEKKSLRERAMEVARDKIEFVPEWGRSRLEGMLEARPDWCISRQRAWGLPIPAFLHPSGSVLLTPASVGAVAEAIREKGSDTWFQATPAQLLKRYDAASDSRAPEWFKKNPSAVVNELEKSSDIFDVWFESGSSWNAVLRRRNIGFPADLYLEGSDQHRGWFQLSLLPALGVTGVSPFKTLLTHGFMVDAQGRKMSKSTGNAIEVEDILKQQGADICRWWVSTLSYTNDVKVDWEYFKVAGEEYRKVRNTIRFLLGNLEGFDSGDDDFEWFPEDRYSVDAWARGQLENFIRVTLQGYQDYQFKRVSEAIFNFCNDTLSAVYLMAVKDRLYCDPVDSRRRRRTQVVIQEIARALIRIVAPILVHTADEAWLALNQCDLESSECVHLERFPEQIEAQADPGWEEVMELRGKALKQLEGFKSTESGLKNPLDAGIEATVPENLLQQLKPFQPELADLCGVSRFVLKSGPSMKIEVRDLRSEPRCERSWKRDETVRRRSDGGYLSDRDAQVVGV